MDNNKSKFWFGTLKGTTGDITNLEELNREIKHCKKLLQEVFTPNRTPEIVEKEFNIKTYIHMLYRIKGEVSSHK